MIQALEHTKASTQRQVEALAEETETAKTQRDQWVAKATAAKLELQQDAERMTGKMEEYKREVQGQIKQLDNRKTALQQTCESLGAMEASARGQMSDLRSRLQQRERQTLRMYKAKIHLRETGRRLRQRCRKRGQALQRALGVNADVTTAANASDQALLSLSLQHVIIRDQVKKLSRMQLVSDCQLRKAQEEVKELRGSHQNDLISWQSHLDRTSADLSVIRAGECLANKTDVAQVDHAPAPLTLKFDELGIEVDLLREHVAGLQNILSKGETALDGAVQEVIADSSVSEIDASCGCGSCGLLCAIARLRDVAMVCANQTTSKETELEATREQQAILNGRKNELQAQQSSQDLEIRRLNDLLEQETQQHDRAMGVWRTANQDLAGKLKEMCDRFGQGCRLLKDWQVAAGRWRGKHHRLYTLYFAQKLLVTKLERRIYG